MSPAAQGPTYTLQRVQQLLGLSRSIVAGLIEAGFVAPARGPRQQLLFGFQDLMLLRTAHALQQAKIPPRKILSALRKLKTSLPAELPVTGLRISAVGSDVTVQDRAGRWAAESGQLVMDFEVAPLAGSVTFLAPAAARSGLSASGWFARGAALEGTDAASAEAAYRQAIALAPEVVDAYLNLGALLSETRRSAEALALYDRALLAAAPTALLHFNRAVALEDQGRSDEAVRAYEQSLALEAGLADAHYNIAILQERLGDARAALRHFSAYRRLSGDT